MLQGSLEESVRRVASLLQLVAELEGRLASHEGGVVQPLLLEREREIQQLSAQVRTLCAICSSFWWSFYS